MAVFMFSSIKADPTGTEDRRSVALPDLPIEDEGIPPETPDTFSSDA
jgi:hypothetical protein